MRRVGLIAVVVLFAVSAGEAADATTYMLGNGLSVTLKPLTTGEKVAIVISYGVGEDDDPEGKSGLAHLVEHCYVTSAAGKTKQRTADEFMARYPRAWNAQTGMRYTVIAVMVPKEDLAAELEEAAARMGALEIAQADLDREIPRIRQELVAMFDAPSGLAASNRAWELARPSPGTGRKGGVIEQIEKLTLEDVQAWHAKHYKPVNARLVLLGPFDEAEAKTLVAKHFGDIPEGEIPTAREPRDAATQPVDKVGRRGGWIARAWRAPAPWYSSTRYPAFLVLARRLMTRSMKHRHDPRKPMFQFAPLDHPEVFTIVKRVTPEESSAEAAAAIDAWWKAIAEEPLAKNEGMDTARDFAWLLGPAPLVDARLAANPYGPAFGIARRAELGLSSGGLVFPLMRLDQVAFDAMLESVFGEDQGATAVVVDPHPAR